MHKNDVILIIKYEKINGYCLNGCEKLISDFYAAVLSLGVEHVAVQTQFILQHAAPIIRTSDKCYIMVYYIRVFQSGL